MKSEETTESESRSGAQAGVTSQKERDFEDCGEREPERMKKTGAERGSQLQSSQFRVVTAGVRKRRGGGNTPSSLFLLASTNVSPRLIDYRYLRPLRLGPVDACSFRWNGGVGRRSGGRKCRRARGRTH
jgi:hypothetical protein